jgi:hypothetical protein
MSSSDAQRHIEKKKKREEKRVQVLDEVEKKLQENKSRNA